MSPANPRGTSNGNCSGNSEQRRRRKVRLVNAWRADVDIIELHEWSELHRVILHETAAMGRELVVAVRGVPVNWVAVRKGLGQSACRCYRCGLLLTKETATADRIKPGNEGGTYAFENLRPSCSSCNSITGNEYRWAKERAEKARRARAAERARARRAASQTSGSDATATAQPVDKTPESTSTSGPEPISAGAS